VCTASVHNTTQNSSDNLPSYLQTNTISQTLSIAGDGVTEIKQESKNDKSRHNKSKALLNDNSITLFHFHIY